MNRLYLLPIYVVVASLLRSIVGMECSTVVSAREIDRVSLL
jgi:hypothetical protein